MNQDHTCLQKQEKDLFPCLILASERILQVLGVSGSQLEGKNNWQNEWVAAACLAPLLRVTTAGNTAEGGLEGEDKEGGMREEASGNKRLPPMTLSSTRFYSSFFSLSTV